jgi:glutamate synthase (NADPH/NADH)
VAAGVSKGKAAHITISGHDGGTGASTWTGIKHAGLPWELGIAETHQTLVLNDLRSRVVLQADGQIRNGLDVVIAALLGSDEIGFATAPLITLGCIMMRKCHLNTCPVGVATQDPVLREKFKGKPEHVINYFFLLAEEVRELMAKLGFCKYSDMVGRVDKLRQRQDITNDKLLSLNYDLLLKNVSELRPNVNIKGGSLEQAFDLKERPDEKILMLARDVIDGTADQVKIEMDITNEDRAFGTTVSYHISLRYKEKGLKDDSIQIRLNGHAGQSFGAFLAPGISLELCGDANDYVGKGLSGGCIVIYPPPSSSFKSEDSIIVGNVVLYGAISGKFFIRGQAAERFCVRNSGANAVSEGCGDHGCEYMTGGVVVILGKTGRNFAAGMSGGIAYVYDPDHQLSSRCNHETIGLESLVEEEDIQALRGLVGEFVDRTKSNVGQMILENWPTCVNHFVKVLPHDYRRVLEESKNKNKILKAVEHNQNTATKKELETTNVRDIEDSVNQIDKVKGFMKYARNTNPYRPVDKRIKDWHEIHNHREVRKHLKTQAARCMDCGVPFCQSKDGCPLGNIVPKWNDLVFQVR